MNDKPQAAPEPNVIERIEGILVDAGEKLLPEDRIAILTQIEAVTQAEAKKVGKERQKLVFQVKTLRAVFMVMVSLFCIGWWRVTGVEEKALAQAYVINIEKLKVGSMAISRALDVVLSEVSKWAKEASEDTQTTPEDRAIRLGNLERLGDMVRGNKKQFEAITERCNVSLKEAPPKINANTVLTDPFTGVAIPLNATKGGRLDESVVTKVLGNEKIIMAYLVLGKQFGGRGTRELPMDLAEVPNAISVDANTLNAVGLKVVKPEAPKKK